MALPLLPPLASFAEDGQYSVILHLFPELEKLAEDFMNRTMQTRVKGRFIAAAGAAFDAALIRRGIRNTRSEFASLSQYASMHPAIMDLSVDKAIEQLGDANSIADTHSTESVVYDHVHDGEAVRHKIIERMKAKGLAFPLQAQQWVSPQYFSPDERKEYQTQWLSAEHADWTTTLKDIASSDPSSTGKFVAIGCGKIIGFYDDKDKAIEASADAIEAVVGAISVSFVRKS